MQFLYPALTWGFLLVLAPLAIHLINLVRQRRLDWAAMEFLREAYRKHQKWIWMRQLLLLAARMLLVALIVALLAHLVTDQQWTRFFAGRSTHHLLLLDDSFSMSDRDTISAFDRGLRAILELSRRAQRETSLQKLSLIRFSRAEQSFRPRTGTESTAAVASGQGEGLQLVERAADIFARVVESTLVDRLAEQIAGWQPSASACTAQSALVLAREAVQGDPTDRYIIYLISDFRRHDWEQPDELRSLLAELHARGASIQFVRCVRDEHANLAVTNLRPAEGIQAAGVPMFYEVSVRNFGPGAVDNLAVQLRTLRDTFNRADQQLSPTLEQPQDLPALLIDSLQPDQEVTERFQVFFPSSGEHVLQAMLPADSVALDNSRLSVISLSDSVPVLVIEGDPQRRNTKFLVTAFRPSARIVTGIRVDYLSPEELRDATPESLEGYSAIYLLDVPRLDIRAQALLQAYVESGGGVALFLGPNAHLDSYNAWFDGPSTLFRLRLDRVEDLPPSADDNPDLEVQPHPLVRIFQGRQNPFLRNVRIQRYIRADVQPAVESSQGPSLPEPSILASLRSGPPLLVQQNLGQGRAIVCLTSLSPLWNNWARQPSFVVFLLELHAFLDSRPQPHSEEVVGRWPQFALPADVYRNEMQVSLLGLSPWLGRSPEPGTSDLGPATPETENAQSPVASPRSGTTVDGAWAPALVESVHREGREWLVPRWDAIRGEQNLPATEQAGLISFWLERQDGKREVRRLAINLDTIDSAMPLAQRESLANQIAPTPITIYEADELAQAAEDSSRNSWSESLLAMILGLLLLEQAWACWLSYHPRLRSAG